MNKMVKNKSLLILIFLSLALRCVYTYRTFTKGISVRYCTLIDNSKLVDMYIHYYGGSCKISYFSKEKISIEMIRKLCKLKQEKEILDSLRDKGINVLGFAFGSGSVNRVEQDYMHIENIEIAEIDSAAHVVLDNNEYSCSFIRLKIKKDGTTFLLLNKDEPNRIELTVNGNNVYLKGQTVIKEKYHRFIW